VRRGSCLVLAALALTAAAPACGALRHLSSRSASGTCAGACDHYVECKPLATASDQAQCERECPLVFSDQDSLSAFESLSCTDTVGFVDGDPAMRADNEAATPTSTQPAPPLVP
jgi:hypothetical protein